MPREGQGVGRGLARDSGSASGVDDSEDAIGALFRRIATEEVAANGTPPDRPGHVASHEEMRRRIIESLEAQGFSRCNDTLVPPDFLDKDDIRKKHQAALQVNLSKAKPGLHRHEDALLARFASGAEVNPEAFSPKLVEVKSESAEALLFRYARLQWSIPTSAGYGRRLRFLVIDESNDKLVGLIGLGDPVFALRPRDQWVGWSREECREGLHNVMDAFVLGAVPPYSYLLAGKLVALLAATDEVRSAFNAKYGRSSSVISARKLRSRLTLVTTTSALGRSSVYNRLRVDGRLVYESVGFTKGSGEFHFSNSLYADIRRFAEVNCAATAKQERWGSGFRSRREVIRKSLVALGLPADWLYHGLRREVFVIPLAANAKTLLRGEARAPRWMHATVAEMGAFAKTRWILPRAERDRRYREFDRECLRIWGPAARRRGS